MLHHEEFFQISNYKLHCCNFWTLPALHLLRTTKKSLAPSAPSHQAAEDCSKIMLEISLLKAEKTQCMANSGSAHQDLRSFLQSCFLSHQPPGLTVEVILPQMQRLHSRSLNVISDQHTSHFPQFGIIRKPAGALCHRGQVINRVDW